MHGTYMYAWYLWTSEEGIESPGSEITDGCEPLYRHWKQNQSQEQIATFPVPIYMILNER